MIRRRLDTLGAAVSVSTVTTRSGAETTTATTNMSYAWYDGAVQSQVAYQAKAGDQASYTNYAYTTAGVFSSAHVQDGRTRDISVLNDALGQAIRRDESDNTNGGDPHELWYRFDGLEIGHVTNNGTTAANYLSSIDQRVRARGTTGAFAGGQSYGTSEAVFGDGYSAITSYDQGSTGGSYTVRAGDTLAGIAAQLWGDAGLWYELATANGLSAGSALAEGTTLTIPTGVTKSGNSADTFKPYDPTDAYGDTSPTTPKPQKKAKNCGAFGAVLIAVVAIAVTAVLTAGVGALATGASFGSAFSSLGSLGSLAVVGSTTGATLGAAGAIAAGVVGAIGGSIVSQGLGIAIGAQDRFSWKAVALAGIGAAVGGAVGQIKGIDGIVAGGGATTTGVKALTSAAARGVISNVAIQSLSVVAGLQTRFSWAGIAVGAVVGATGRLTNVGGTGGRFVSGTAGAIAGGATRSLIDGSDFGDNVMAALPDVIASLAVDYITDRITQKGAPPPADPTPSTSAPPASGVMMIAALSAQIPLIVMPDPAPQADTQDDPQSDIVVLGQRLEKSGGILGLLGLGLRTLGNFLFNAGTDNARDGDAAVNRITMRITADRNRQAASVGRPTSPSFEIGVPLGRYHYGGRDYVSAGAKLNAMSQDVSKGMINTGRPDKYVDLGPVIVPERTVYAMANLPGAALSSHLTDVIGVYVDLFPKSRSNSAGLAFGMGAAVVAAESLGAKFGTSTTSNYRKTFFAANPELEGQVVVHHAVEQQALKLYPSQVTTSEINSLENLRGIPNEINSKLHLSTVRKEWNRFYLANPDATKAQILQKATEIDMKYGSQFNPPLRR